MVQTDLTRAMASSRLLCAEPGLGLSHVRVSAAKLRSFGGCEAPQNLLCVDVQGAAPTPALAAKRNPIDLVLIIDVSFSMSSAMEDVRETCRQIFSELHSQDRICLVTFSAEAKVVLPLTPKDQVQDFNGYCSQLKEESCTNIEAGLKEGIRQLNTTVASNGYWPFRQTTGRPVDQVPSSHTAVSILLSDGQPNAGFTGSEDLLRLAEDEMSATQRSVTLHAFGFTSGHAIEIMSSLPSKSNGPVGSYYYLEQSLDIAAAVGDCLGAASAHRVCQGLTFRMSLPESNGGASGWFGPPIGDDSEDAPLLGIQAGDCRELGALAAEEQQAQLYVVQEDLKKATLHLSWQSEGDEQLFACDLDLSALAGLAPLTLAEPTSSASLSELGVCAHALRLEAASALSALALSPDLSDRYQELHASVLACLHALQALTEECSEEQEREALFLEGMLQALERDLGDAIAEPGSNSQRKGVLLSFAAEHFGMRSASSLTRVRTAYASRQQIQTRLRFLQSACGAEATAKASCPVQEDGLNDDEVECRKAVDEQVCYAMLSNWRECVLGVGLYVHPRTLRERRARIPPEVDLVLDYVSAEAYNLGVRSSVQQGPGWDEEEAQEPAEVLRSTVKRRINAWLPLYINSTNWAVAKTFAPSAFSLIATQLNASFQAGDALKVCARLMCCAVVGFVRSPDTWERAQASERSVQMYCDIHRLLLQMAQDYPSIQKIARDQVEGFISRPEMRTRKGTSDLGLLIVYLSLVDDVQWSDMWHVFVPEMVRRAFARMSEAFQPDECDSLQELVERFDTLEPEHGRVIAFFLVFTSIVSKPQDGPASAKQAFTEVCSMYDRRWGQLPADRRSEVLADVTRICRCKSVKEVLAELMPAAPSEEDLAELLLWANKNGHNVKAILRVPEFPMKEHPLTDNWRSAVTRRQRLCAEVEEALASGRPKAECLELLLDLARRPQHPEEQPASKHRFASREEASAAAALARREAEARKSAKESGKGLGKGVGKGLGADLPTISNKPVLDISPAKEQGLTDQPFKLQLRVSGSLVDADGNVDMDVSMRYFEGDELTLVGDLRAAIAQKTGTYSEQLRLILRGAKHRDITKRGVTDFSLHDDEPLMDWHLNDSEPVVVEVKKKQRAGKKLPGNGWFNKRGRTCTMNIAGAIVKQMVFSKADQYCVKVEEPRICETIMKLCEHFRADATVLAAADAEQLPECAKAQGFSVEADADLGVTKLVSAQRRLTLLSERDDPDFSTDMLQGEQDPEQDQLPELPAVVHVPTEAVGSKLVFVLGGDVLRETASLTKVIRSLHRPSAEPLTVFHLITSHRHKLQLPSLGFVVRMRDRFGCDIPQLPNALLDRILALHDAEAAGDQC